MRISNLFDFTEHHRFVTRRDFSLSPLDHRMLSSVYQPMIGPEAVSLYLYFYQMLPPDRLGWGTLEQQRKLFLALNKEMSDKGRRQLIALTSALEAISLLETSRLYMAEEDEHIYEYTLIAPLAPQAFFQTAHLSMLLRDRVGLYMLEELRNSFIVDHASFIKQGLRDELTVPFYEIFQLTAEGLEHEWVSDPPALPLVPQRAVEADGANTPFRYTDLLTRFPKGSPNRIFIGELEHRPEQMALINYVVLKYDLTLQEICRLLDEDGIFDKEGRIIEDVLQHRANLNFRQDKRRSEARQRMLQRVQPPAEMPAPLEAVPDTAQLLEVPEMLRERYDQQAYNRLLQTQPHVQVLKLFFPGAIPDHVLNVFEKIDLNYRLGEAVINVLIHHLKVSQLSWNRNFVDSIASDMLGKQIDSFDKAVLYIRQWGGKTQSVAGQNSERGKRTGHRRKPQIPIIGEAEKQDTTLTDEELAQIREIVRELDGT